MIKIALILLLFLSSSLASTSNFGLRSKDNQPLQLLDLKTKATIEGPYASIEYTHTYNNPYNQPLETEFYFPRTDNSVFHKFEAIFQNQTIVGQVLEKTQAKEMYEWNVQRGNTVAYSERNALVPDVMQILVGNIPAGEKVDIRFSVIQPLEVVVNQFWGFTLPSVLTERYTPLSVDPSQVPNVVNVGLEDSMYKEWKVFVEIRSDTPFEYIANPSHKIIPQYANNASSGIYKAVWDVTIVPNKDFVVYFRAEKLEVPSVIKATHPQYPNDHVMLVNFVPQLNTLDAQDSQQKLENNEEGFLELKKLALEEDIKYAKGEFIFVIDRSGSMGGNRIENLKKALIRFFQVLPKDSYFNIVSFGSSHSLYKPESVRYTPQTVHDIMVNWIPYVQADMGGTEILTAIQRASSLPMMSGYPRTIMLLTDGDVHNPDQVVNHALTHSEKMRFCSVGIGYGASEYLVKNFAKAGKCTSVLVQENEDIGDKAIYMVKAAISRYLENIDFTVTCFDTSEKEIFKQTEKVGMLLKDLAFKQWVYLRDIENLGSCKVKLEYYNSLKEEQFREEIDIRGFQTAEVTDLWHKVAYDAKIREMDLIVKSNRDSYQNIQDLKVKIEKLAVKYQVLSDYTAFLAVIQESVQNTQQGDRLKVTIPNLDSADHCAESAEMASGGNIDEEAAKVNAAPSAARYAASSADSFSQRRYSKAAPSSASYVAGSAQSMYAQVDQSASYSSASGGSYYYQGADWLMTRSLLLVLCFIFIAFFVL